MKARDGILFELLIISMNTQGERNKINYRKTSSKLEQLRVTITFYSPIVHNRNVEEGKMAGSLLLQQQNLHHKNRFSTRSVLFSLPE